VDSEGNSQVICSDIGCDFEKRLKQAIQGILCVHGRADLDDLVVQCVLELATNATKANVKHLYFREKNWDIHDSRRYLERLEAFRAEVLHHEPMTIYSRRALDEGLSVRVVLEHDARGLKVEVINNLPIIAADERRIREKFRYAMKYESLLDFYMNHGDLSEGSGLGFALTVLILRSKNIPPSFLRVGMRGAETVARIEIPFTDDHQAELCSSRSRVAQTITDL